MKHLRIFLTLLLFACVFFIDQTPSRAALLIPTTTKLKVAGFQPFVVFQTISLTATVSPMSGNDRGSVFFSNATNFPIAEGPVDPDGHFTGTITPGGPGVFQIHAVFVNSGTFAQSVSPFVNLQVVKAWTATTLTSTNPNVSLGQAVTFSTTVEALAPSMPPAGTFPGGSITYYEGSTVIGTSGLFHGFASFTATLPLGTHSIVASYSGNSNFTGSLSPQTILVTVS